MIRNLLSLSLLLLVSYTATSQIDFDTTTSSLIMEAGTRQKANIQLTNNTGHPVQLEWSLIESTLNDNDDGDNDNSNNWELQFCDCNTCYVNFGGPIPSGGSCFDLMSSHPDSNSIGWYLTVKPNGQPMIDAHFIIEVRNITDGFTDTLTYLAIHPNSVKDVAYNAEVTTYPNPANTELVVNYDLSHVSQPTLKVYSIIGVEMAQYPLNALNGFLRIPTTQFENGMYFFTIEEKGQRIFQQKFNVMH